MPACFRRASSQVPSTDGAQPESIQRVSFHPASIVLTMRSELHIGLCVLLQAAEKKNNLDSKANSINCH